MLPHHVLLRTERTPSKRSDVCLFGPGGSPEGQEPDFSETTVLEAEAIEFLPNFSQGNVTVTPHQGEFKR